MTQVETRSDSAARLDSDRFMIVSTDDHAGPRPSRFLRDYCPPQYLERFDEFTREQDAAAKVHDDAVAAARERIANGTAHVRDLSLHQLGNCRDCAGHYDPHVRLRDMDSDGVAAQIIFAGGQNDTELPWVGFGWNAGPSANSELKKVSYRMWNHWISDYITTDPKRLRGVMQIPIWDIDAAVREVEWGAERGLDVINLHAPRDDYPPFTDLAYERFWAAAEAANCTLVTHAGASAPYGPDVRRQYLLTQAEFHWYGNRGLHQLIFGGVFERFPGLKFTLTEQRVDFAPGVVKHLDSIYDNIMMQNKDALAEPRGGIINPSWPTEPDPNDPEPLATTLRRPSEYWREHGFLSGSFLAPFEADLRHEVGMGNLMWGSDYPHCEGTWPDTRVALRRTFASMDVDEARQILGENAIGVYHLDRPYLRALADRIGPHPADIQVPVDLEEIPDARSWAFRNEANFT